jgi:hypothetical protein
MNFIDENHKRIIGDVISALRAEPFPLASFSCWDKWDGEILARLPEPNEAAKMILERQGEANVEIDEAEIVEDYFFEQLSARSTTHPMRIKSVFRFRLQALGGSRRAVIGRSC